MAASPRIFSADGAGDSGKFSTSANSCRRFFEAFNFHGESLFHSETLFLADLLASASTVFRESA